MIKYIILSLLLVISFPAQAAYIPVGGTNGQIQYNNNGAFGGLPLVTPALGGTGTSTLFTQGYVIFAGVAGVYSSSSSLFYDNANSRLGIGTTVPLSTLEVNGTASMGVNNIVIGSSATATAQQVRGTLINNYGQSAEETITLPVAAVGYKFILMVGTASGYPLYLKPASSDVIYLDGTALTTNYKIGLSVPAVGNYVTCWTFQTGLTAYSWSCTTGSGSWISMGL
jgi:hypothetical protein